MSESVENLYGKDSAIRNFIKSKRDWNWGSKPLRTGSVKWICTREECDIGLL